MLPVNDVKIVVYSILVSLGCFRDLIDVLVCVLLVDDCSYNYDFLVSRLNEAVMHFGESIKEIINEDFGDGM